MRINPSYNPIYNAFRTFNLFHFLIGSDWIGMAAQSMYALGCASRNKGTSRIRIRGTIDAFLSIIVIEIWYFSMLLFMWIWNEFSSSSINPSLSCWRIPILLSMSLLDLQEWMETILNMALRNALLQIRLLIPLICTIYCWFRWEIENEGNQWAISNYTKWNIDW